MRGDTTVLFSKTTKMHLFLLTYHPPPHPLLAKRVKRERDCLVEYVSVVCLTH